MDQGFNLAPLVSSLIQAVPVWAIVGFSILWMIRKFEKSWEKTTDEIEAIKLGQEQIRLQLASLHLPELHRRVDLIENQTQSLEEEIREMHRKSSLKKREV